MTNRQGLALREPVPVVVLSIVLRKIHRKKINAQQSSGILFCNQVDVGLGEAEFVHQQTDETIHPLHWRAVAPLAQAEHVSACPRETAFLFVTKEIVKDILSVILMLPPE